MKVIIAGGRNLTDYGLVVEAIFLAKFDITEVVSGACGIDADDPRRDGLLAKGGDGLGEDWAYFNGIPILRFYAAWKRLGLKAGPLRNAEMAEYADALLALPGNKGTADMIKQARQKMIPLRRTCDQKLLAASSSISKISSTRSIPNYLLASRR